MEFKHIIYTETAGIATITINRPKVYNAFNSGTCEELIQAFGMAGSWETGVEGEGMAMSTSAGSQGVIGATRGAGGRVDLAARRSAPPRPAIARRCTAHQRAPSVAARSQP